MKNKKAFKATILVTILVIITAITYAGVSPLLEKQALYKKAEIAFQNTGASLASNYSCFSLLKQNYDKLDNIRVELSENEGFLGAYSYPDTELIETINYGTDLSEQITNSGMANEKKGFLSYEYNEGLNKLGLVKLQEGKMFDFRAYSTSEEVPVIVTENEFFKIGDKIKLNLNVVNSNIADYPNAKPVSVNAVVCGIAKKNIYLPFLSINTGSSLTRFSKINELFWVFTPDLSEYTKLFNYQPTLKRNESAKFYALYEGGSRDPYVNVINKYGFYSSNETLNVNNVTLQYEIQEYKENNYNLSWVALITLYGISATCLVKEIVMVYYRKKD